MHNCPFEKNITHAQHMHMQIQNIPALQRGCAVLCCCDHVGIISCAHEVDKI